jgi:hypothetical protein
MLLKVRERYEDTSQVIFKDMVRQRSPSKRSLSLPVELEIASVRSERNTAVEQRTVKSGSVQSNFCVIS